MTPHRSGTEGAVTEATPRQHFAAGAGRRVARGPVETYLIEREGAAVTVTARDRKAGDTSSRHTFTQARRVKRQSCLVGVALGFTAAGYDVAWENSPQPGGGSQ